MLPTVIRVSLVAACGMKHSRIQREQRVLLMMKNEGLMIQMRIMLRSAGSIVFGNFHYLLIKEYFDAFIEVGIDFSEIRNLGKQF